MLGSGRKLFVAVVAVIIVSGLLAPSGYCKDGKVGYVDLRRAFYEYNKWRTLEGELNGLTEDRQKERSGKVDAITKLREEAKLLSGKAKEKKQSEIDAELVKLQDFDRQTRQELLSKKSDMFREVIGDIQDVVEEIGKKGNYDYIFDSRNIMYAREDLDLTDKVVKQLNNK